jgi:hypothetical protein
VKPATRGPDAQIELIGLAVMLLDLCAIHPLLALIAGPATDGGARLPLWPLVALALAARGVVWGLERRDASPRAYRAVTTGAALLSLAAALWLALGPGRPPDADALGAFVRDLTRPAGAGPAAAGFILAGLYIWRQALMGVAPTLGKIYTRFERILPAFLLYLAVAWLAGAAFMSAVLTRDLFGVFLAGLTAMALARGRMEGDARRHELGTRWILTSVAIVGAILGLGLLAGGLFGAGLTEALFGPLWVAVQLIGVVVVGAIYLVVTSFFLLLEFLFGWLRTPGDKPPPPPPAPAVDIQKYLQQLAEHDTAARADYAWLGFVGVAIVAIILLLVARAALRSAQRRRHDLGGGQRESLLDWAALVRSLQPQRAGGAAALPDPLLLLARDPAYRHTVRIRRAYRAALARGAARGVARLPSQTASEALPALQGALPAARDPLATLTHLYDATRYTATPAAPEDAEAAERAVRALDAP